MKTKILDILLIIFVIALGVYFFKLVQGNNELSSKFQVQEFQARSLIDEVGQTKEENRILSDKLIVSEQTLKKLEEKLGEVIGESVKSENVDNATEGVGKPKIARREVAPIINTQNFLIVGNHMGLADSIILVAVDPGKRKITLVSIPRDLYVNGRKINEYHALYGIDVLVEKVEEVIGLKINKYLVMNFNAFENVIDFLGGIDIYVEKAINDYAYPAGENKYIVYSIDAGSHHMNGDDALKYVRSRHSTSDFDRALRQQQVVRAAQERVINFDFLSNLDKVAGIYNAVISGMNTTITIADIVRYLQDYQNFEIEGGNVISTANYLKPSINVAGQYILLPRAGDFREIKDYIVDLLGK